MTSLVPRQSALIVTDQRDPSRWIAPARRLRTATSGRGMPNEAYAPVCGPSQASAGNSVVRVGSPHAAAPPPANAICAGQPDIGRPDADVWPPAVELPLAASNIIIITRRDCTAWLPLPSA